MRLTLVSLWGLSAFASALASAGTLIQSCESVEGVVPRDGRALNGALLEVNTDSRFVSQGEGSLRMRATTSAGANVTYLSMDIPIPTTDFRAAALTFDAWSSAPESTRAFYVRGYDADGRCALSWMTWNASLGMARSRITLVPGMRSSGMKWEPDELKDGDQAAVSSLRVYVGGKGGEQILDLYIDRITAVPRDLATLAGTGGSVPDLARFTDHGIGARAAELRGVVGMAGTDGRPYVIGVISDSGSRGSVLVTDVLSGKTHQVYCPEGIRQVDAFGGLASSRGRFYYTQGAMVLELDPSTQTWTYSGRPIADVSVYLCFTEGPDGTIWLGGVYKTQLASYDPESQEVRDHGRLDPVEQYVSYLAVDDKGWIYGGIGTARCNIVAYHPETGEKRSLVAEADRTVGTALVFPAADGSAIGRVSGRHMRLFDGMATALAKEEVPARRDVKALRYGARLRDLPDGRRIQRYDLESGRIGITGGGADASTTLPFSYDSEGARITSLGAGPDGVVYGSTSHPMHFLAFDTTRGELQDYGAIPLVGGGNFCAIVAHGRTVFGAQYAAGRLWAFDVDRPWLLESRPSIIGVSPQALAERGRVAPGHLSYLASHEIVFIHGDAWDAEAVFPLVAKGVAPAAYYVYVHPYRHSNYCTVQLSLGDRPLGAPVAGASAVTEAGPVLEYGPYRLAPGEHHLRVRLLPDTGESPFFGIRSAAISTERLDIAVTASQANPRPIGRWQDDVCRPRTALVHPDGRHVMMAGFAGYGRVGGGIGIVDLQTGEDILLTAANELLPGHSCITLRALPNGNLIGGTSISAPGGGHPTAKEAEVFVLDWNSKTVIQRVVPVPGDRNIVSLTTIGYLTYGLSGNSTFFVFDAETREVVYRENLDRYGSVPRHALHNGSDGMLYAIMSDALIRIDPSTWKHHLLSWTPVRAQAGGALVNGLLCFAGGSRVWSYAVPNPRPVQDE